jgi:hypothetical protein
MDEAGPLWSPDKRNTIIRRNVTFERDEGLGSPGEPVFRVRSVDGRIIETIGRGHPLYFYVAAIFHLALSKDDVHDPEQRGRMGYR